MRLLVLLLAASCSVSTTAPPVDERAIAARVTQSAIEPHVRTLASDEFEGRFPGTRGEELAVRYIEGQFRRLRLQPAAPDGTYVQAFDLQAQRTKAEASLNLRGARSPLAVPAEAAFVATHVQPRTNVRDSELVFAGYGVVAPEHGWDDYAGVDVRGKTVLVLRDEPEPRLAGDSAGPDPALFRGSQATLHSRIERKRAVAHERGAAAVLLLARADRGFALQAEQFSREFITFGNEPWPPVIGVLAPAVRQRIYAAANRDFEKDSAAAGVRGFRALALGVTISIDLQSEWRRIRTRNVLAKLQGVDRSVRDEHVIFTAHWDAFGIGAPVNGDAIYNGAVDDAVGVGQLLATAEALATTRPKRTMIFLVTSAEEHGLLGARHYAAHPALPLSKALLNVNYDIVDTSGATRDVRMYGSGRSTLDTAVREAARLQDRIVTDDTVAAASSQLWFLQDHLAFAEKGVPALSVASGNDVIGKPPGYAEKRAQEYRTSRYHQPSDEILEDWDWGSIVQDAQLGVLLGLRFSERGERIRFTPGVDVPMGLPATALRMLAPNMVLSTVQETI